MATHKNKKILVVAAHPDDEVLGCGGTIAKRSREGDIIYSLILGECTILENGIRDRAKGRSQFLKLKSQIKKANRVLGVKENFAFDFPDNRFDAVPLLDIIKTVERIKEQVRPDIIFTHHRGDLNIDHRIIFEAVLTAARPVKNETVKEIYSFEIPSSTEWSHANAADYFMPILFIDISKTLRLKIEALKEYATEIRDYPHPRSPQAIEVIAKKRGIEVGLIAAEAFEVVRLIKTDRL